MFEKGDIVEKYSGDYGGPGVIEAVLDISDGRRRYLVAHKISGGWGTLLHIYGESQLRKYDPAAHRSLEELAIAFWEDESWRASGKPRNIDWEAATEYERTRYLRFAQIALDMVKT